MEVTQSKKIDNAPGLERLARDEHSNFLDQFVSYDEKSFENSAPEWRQYQHLLKILSDVMLLR